MKTQIPQATLFFLLKTKPSPQVLLGRKKRGLGKGKILGVGGKVESGENILGAALREVREEISVTIPKESAKKIGELTFLFPHQPSWSQKVHVVVQLLFSYVYLSLHPPHHCRHKHICGFSVCCFCCWHCPPTLWPHLMLSRGG